MNFRQRIAWILLSSYLLLTLALFYYVFEISDRFNHFAVDHANLFHAKDKHANDPVKPLFVRDLAQKLQKQDKHLQEEQDSSSSSSSSSDKSDSSSTVWHLLDVPLFIWVLALVIPYIQTFCMLLACTKPDPRLSFAYRWPCVVVMKAYSLLSHPGGRRVQTVSRQIIDT